MRENLAKLLFLAAAAVNLAPAGIAFAPERVADLYGIAPIGSVDEVVLSVAGGDAVLVKGSRVAGLERLAARLLE